MHRPQDARTIETGRLVMRSFQELFLSQSLNQQFNRGQNAANDALITPLSFPLLAGRGQGGKSWKA